MTGMAGLVKSMTAKTKLLSEPATATLGMTPSPRAECTSTPVITRNRIGVNDAIYLLTGGNTWWEEFQTLHPSQRQSPPCLRLNADMARLPAHLGAGQSHRDEPGSPTSRTMRSDAVRPTQSREALLPLHKTRYHLSIRGDPSCTRHPGESRNRHASRWW